MKYDKLFDYVDFKITEFIICKYNTHRMRVRIYKNKYFLHLQSSKIDHFFIFEGSHIDQSL